MDPNAFAAVRLYQLGPVRHTVDVDIRWAPDSGHEALAFQGSGKVIRKQAFAMLPPTADEIAKIGYRPKGLPSGPNGWPSFIYLASARMMDETNVVAPSRPQRNRVKLSVDLDLPRAELVWQSINVMEDVDDHVRGRLGAVAPTLTDDWPDIPDLLLGN
ncbi:hypothetical protein [Bradyrhizobium sp. CCGUVB23]|uniref:hypothetical protein n=1 Tax=Bradyrhizobium sp. CCGUVB23 TaxID=2949630 RepID=UPI0020B4490B|nr:hypothetical protein [Bradyrhizobium sp. CCGUVB23]MCP3460616.1 hypothetical protein [Bradyrhizobium sp. CCGUVB23]